MFKKPFVVLDLETSGVDPKKNDIIEVAAIRYENGKEVARLDDLIKIDYKLPRIITVITGITDAELKKKGRPKEEVLEEAEELLRGAYLVGHNINFDVGFLKAAGLELDVPGLIDTIPLAQIVFPEAASYSLEALSEDLEISHKNSHRAMSDAEATLDLFRELFRRIDSLPKRVLTEIRQFLSRSMWEGGVVFSEAKGKVSKKETSICGVPIHMSGKPPRALEIEEIFKEGGAMQEVLPGWESRPQQVEMAKNVMNAFDQGYHLICEAPTGVGKSLAYLAAAANIAIKNKSKVVISTNTINLQQQLYEKDIPLLSKLYRHATNHPGVRTAVLKGRRHYLCLRRLAEFKRRPRFTDAETVLLIKILVWQATSLTGDCGEIHLTKQESIIWDFELCSDKKYCSPIKCKPYGECYLHKARELAESADIVVVNHALLCADMESAGSLLPDYRYLVIDEAHHFEEAATQAFGVDISQENVSLPIKLAVNHLEDFKRRHGAKLAVSHSAFQAVDRVLSEIPDLQQFIDSFFSVVALFTNRHVPESAYIENLLVDRTVLAMQDWLNLGDSMREVGERVAVFLGRLKKLVDSILLVGGNEIPDAEEFTDELLLEIEVLQEQMANLNSFFNEEENPERRQIRWMSSDLHGIVLLHMAPMVVGPLLGDRLYDEKKSIVLTSATLGVQIKNGEEEIHPFTYLRNMLGLDERFEEIMLGSPFNFETQAYVLLPTDVLPLTATKSMEEISGFFASLIEKVKGGILGLFTSYASIETLYMRLMDCPEAHGSKIIGQRISGGRNKVMKAYMNDPTNSVLFGTASFWEGIDIQGEALTTLVIHRLPFDVPSEPIFKARQELFSNSFMEYSVPRAVLRFRQGFGRLIRSTRDFGALIVLDNRITAKDYGQMFLQALPEGITVEKAKLLEIPGKVESWLKLSGDLL